MRLLLVALLILLTAVPSHAIAAPPLQGCFSESEIASATSKVAQQEWDTVSLAKLRTMWPRELSGLNCEADVCHSVWSMDRIISGHCECCETFAFQVRSSGSRRIEQLDEVVLNYSARDKEHLVSAARKIGAAIGMSPTDLATIGSANEQNFHWNTITGNHREISAAEVRLSHRGQGWELFLNWGRNLDEPSNGNSP